jgi:hypothetical protein
LIDGRHAEKKKLEKQKEILSVQNKLRNLVIPEKPIVPNEPTKPVEPILRAEPTMSFEEKIVKDDVLEVFKEHMA